MPDINQPDLSTYYFLQRGGNMGKLIRELDWAQTPIGSADTWPSSLKISVSTILSSPFPMYIAWGKEYTQIYNDGYRPILGSTKHPKALGLSTKQTFGEIWTTIGPMFDGVMEGRAVGFNNFHFKLNRNGYTEDCYFDFSYSPIYLDNGEVGGVLVTVIEVTDKLNALKELKQIKDQLEIAQAEAENERDRLKAFFMQAPAAICVCDGPDLVFELVNSGYQAFFPGRQLLGKPVYKALPEIKGTLIEDILINVYSKAETYVGNEQLIPLAEFEGGPTKERYFNFIYQPRFNVHKEVDGIQVFAFEVTDMVLARQKLKETSENFKLLADNIAQLAWMADEKGALYWYNQRWYDYTGTTYEEMRGWGWEAVQHPDHVGLVKERWKRFIDNGEVWEDTFPLKSKEGEYRWFYSQAVPLKDENGKVIRWFGTNTDVTEQRLLEQQKDDFISIASHELKTPITSLKASLQLLDRMKGEPSIKHLPTLIAQSTRSVKKISILVDDLLNVTRLNQGHLQLTTTKFCICNVLNNCCGDIKLAGEFNMVIKCDPNLGVLADEHQIEQVLVNFVSNAVKYAPESKSIVLKAELINDQVKVSVQDFGPGISKDKQSRLFDRYYRAVQSQYDTSGLGLGLYICSEIIKRHGGDIGVDSEVGKGSTFWFTLPIST